MSREEHSNNLFKFLKVSRERKNRIYKKCYPSETYGVSKESPMEFGGDHTLFSQRGYHYQHDDKMACGNNEFYAFSQKKFFTIDHSDQPTSFNIYMSKALESKPLIFHRKKGLLSYYMDKNGWMSKVHKLMGKYRSETARGINNRYRDLRVRSLKKSPNSVEYQTVEVLQKPVDRKYFETIPALMGEKMRIRRSRNKFVSEMQTRRKEHEDRSSIPFRVDNFYKRYLSLEMSKRAQTSRTYYEQSMGRTMNFSEFRKTNGFRSTWAETFREQATAKKQSYESEDEIDNMDRFDNNAYLYRTQKIIPRKTLLNE